MLVTVYMYDICIVISPLQSKVVVEALYDCVPDHRDELGFREGEKVVITKKLNRDWWVRSCN